jgi:branched-chain amino acid transport system ATP-binding protein
MSGIVETRNVSLIFGGLKAVDRVNFEITSGEIRGLIGPNGSGKSSLINLISNVYKPTDGKIFFQGEDITGLSPHQTTIKGISRTFQTIRLFPNLTVLENVLVGGHCRSYAGILQVVLRSNAMKEEEERLVEKAHHLLELLGLVGMEKSQADNVSHGQQRLIEVARALMSDPLLLLLDEPTAGLSPKETDDVAATILAIRDSGVTVLLVEHKMEFVLGISDSITVLNSGAKIAEGTPEQIKKNLEVIKAYLGSEPDYAIS